MTDLEYQALVKLILDSQQPEFYEDITFWISLIFGLIGIYLSYIAYKQASEANTAARAAGTVVKLQSITIELTEIMQRMDKLSTELDYSDARDFYNELNRKVRRCISVLNIDPNYSNKTKEIIQTLVNIKNNLEQVRQTGSTDQTLLAGIDLYYAIEGEFTSLSGQLADLCGTLENKTLE